MNESIASFYSRPSLHVEIYDVQTAATWLRDDDAFYLEEARASGGPVLELACGTGRLTIPLLSTGLEIHGLDASAAMLGEVRRKREQLPPESANLLHLHSGDMARFKLERKFALIFIAFRSFQILATPEAQRQCLACVREHLAAGGKLIINLFDPRYEMILPGRQEGLFSPREFVHPVSGNRVLVETMERVNEPLSQTFEERWRFTEISSAGEVLRQEEEQLKLRWTFRYEMRHLVESCGFEVEAEYSDFHRTPPAYGKEQIWVLKAAQA
jgi:SAM-dependent methyltransferase